MTTATLAQGLKILTMIEQKEVPADQVREILSSGLLSDLLDGNIGQVKRDEFRKLLGLRNGLWLKVDDSYTGGQPWSSAYGHMMVHSPERNRKELVEIRLIDGKEFLRDPHSNEVLRMGRSLGYLRPTADLADFFRDQLGRKQLPGRPIVFLHQPAVDLDGHRHVLTVNTDGEKIWPEFGWFDSRWPRNCLFAFVGSMVLEPEQHRSGGSLGLVA